MAYNPDIWEDLTKDEKMAYRIFEAWRTVSLKNGVEMRLLSALPSAESKVKLDPDNNYGKYPGDKIRNHKNFKIFLEVWEMFKDDELFDPYIYISSILKGYDKRKYLYPGALKTKSAQKFYYQYKSSMEELSEPTDDEKIIRINIVGTYNAIRGRLQKKSLSTEDLRDFFNAKLEDTLFGMGMILAIHKMLSPHYLSVSKSFETAWKNADPDVQFEMLDEKVYNNLRSYVKINSKLYGFVKSIFGADII